MKNQKKIPLKAGNFYIDKNLYAAFQHFILSLKLNWDFVFIIDGVPGVGKTSWSFAVGSWLNGGKIKIINIVFTADQFLHAVDTLPLDSVIIWDESVLGLLSAEIGKMAIVMYKKFATIRSKRLKIILNAPQYHDLKRYIALTRSKFLIHLTTPDFLHRGDFSHYSYRRKNLMYIKNKATGLYMGVKPNFQGKIVYEPGFVKNLIDWDEYEKRKQEAIDTTNDIEKRYQEQRNNIILRYVDDLKTEGLKKKQLFANIGEITDMSPVSVSNLYYELKGGKK